VLLGRAKFQEYSNSHCPSGQRVQEKTGKPSPLADFHVFPRRKTRPRARTSGMGAFPEDQKIEQEKPQAVSRKHTNNIARAVSRGWKL